MADSTGAGGKRPPSLWWFAVAAVVLVLGLVPFGWVLANTVQGIADYEVHQFGGARSTTVSVDDGQVAIFSTYDSAGTVRCQGAPTDTAEPNDFAMLEPLEHPSTSLNLSVGGMNWSRVAVTPDGWTDGAYTVRCDVVSPGSGSPQPILGYADNPSIMSTVIGFAIAVAIAVLAGVVALAIAIAVGVKRYKANRPRLPDRPVFPPSPPGPSP